MEHEISYEPDITIKEYKEGLLKSLDIEIGLTGGNDDYHIGIRNGLRICKAFINGVTPDYE